MFRMLWLVMLLLLSGCARDHDIPPARLEYIDVSKKNKNFYTIKFSSDADLLSVFKPEDSPVGGLLRCSLSSDDAANENGTERYVASGLIYAVKSQSRSDTFVYSSSVMFSESINDGRTYRPLEVRELREILNARQSVSCIYRFTAYGFKPYYSGLLSIPVRDILRELDR